MSAEYLLKMEVLRRNREELAARRQEIERRIALREATAAEYSAIALQSCKQKWKSLRASALAAKKRNDEFIREVRETQRKVDDAYVRTTQKLWPSDNQLEIEKARYLRKVEELYPAWQEKMQAVRIQTLRELEEKKRAIEKRRYHAKKTFETEQTLDDLIQQTSHEIGLAENMEKNEAFEREVLRSQSVIQAMRLDETIREHADGARMYMKRQAMEQLTAAQRVPESIEDKLFETFSPRGAVKAMRQANNAIDFAESVDNNAQDTQQRRRRSQTIALPSRQHHTRATEDPLPDPYVNTKHDTNDPTTSARTWARSGLVSGKGNAGHNSSEPQNTGYTMSQADLNTGYFSARLDTAQASIPINQLAPHEGPDAKDSTRPASLCISSNKVKQSSVPAYDAIMSEVPVIGDPETSRGQENISDVAAAFYKLSTFAGVSSARDTMAKHEEQQVNPLESPVTDVSSDRAEREGDRQVAALKAGFMALTRSTLSPDPQTASDRLLMQQLPLEGETESKRFLPQQQQNDHEESNRAKPVHRHQEGISVSTSADNEVERNLTLNAEEDPQPPVMGVFEKYKVVELTQRETPSRMNDTIMEGKPVHNVEIDSNKTPSLEPSVTADDGTPPTDLSLNLINSYDSNQSSVMNFSVGKLLQTPVKATFESSASGAAEGKSVQPVIGPIHTAPFTQSVRETSLTNIDSPAGEGGSEFARPNEIKSGATSSSGGTNSSNHSISRFEEGKQETEQASLKSTHNPAPSLVFSSFESASGMTSSALNGGDDTMIESISDFGSPIPAMKSLPSPADSIAMNAMSIQGNSPPQSPTESHSLSPELPSLFATLAMPERLKALTALIARVEEGVNEGEQLSALITDEVSRDTKRELLRMAVSGRKAQINFFGSDVCFELVVDLARELGPVLFPAKAFEGILNDQKMKKVHQNGKEKEADIWRAFATHLKQLHTAKAIPVSSLVDLFTTAFLSHDPSNQRSQRKLRELLFAVCGASESSTTKPVAASLPYQDVEQKETAQPRGSMSAERETPSSPQIPTLLQTAFLQTTSPPKPKTYGIASSSFKKRSSTDDLLKSMASSPARLSQKLMRGGKMGDYSEFEEEDEVDLDNLIGTKPSMAATQTTNTSAAKAGARGPAGPSTARLGGAARDDKDDFDVDF